MTKLFIGIEIPEDIKQHVFDYVLPMQKTPKGWEQPHDYHQTLLFLGETTDEKCDEVKKRLDQLTYKPFELEAASIEFFSRRIMYLGFSPSSELLELKKLVDQAFPEWVRKDEKPFIAHATIKRWQRYEFNYLQAAVKNKTFRPLKFKVTGLALFKSEKDLENKKYHVIHRVIF